jgi:hypothetical protein
MGEKNVLNRYLQKEEQMIKLIELKNREKTYEEIFVPFSCGAYDAHDACSLHSK